MSPAPLDISALDIEQARLEIQRIEYELQRRAWVQAPDLWARERLGDVLWSAQRRILQAVATSRKTAVFTCHDIGKSFAAALAAGWWLDTHKPGEAVVVSTAPTGPQVKVILWKEIGRVHVRGKLAGRVNQTEWLMDVNGKEEIVALGRKPSDYSPEAFQGIHAPYVLVIVDEANGVRGPLWNAIDSLVMNEGSKILAIGNPDIPSGEFFEHCRPGSGWTVQQVGAFDSPNFTGESLPPSIAQQLISRIDVEEKRRRWAPQWRWTDDGSRCLPPSGTKIEDTSSPLWQSKVLGLFPKVLGDHTLIQMEWIRAAQDRTLEPLGDNTLGQDVGGGGDSSTIAHRRGPVVRILHEDHNPDTMHTCGLLLETIRRTRAVKARVDVIGIGRGVVDRAKEVRRDIENQGKVVPWFVVGVNVSEAAVNDEDFENLRAELWWHVRTLFETGTIDIDPLDEDLAAELATIRFERTSRGRIKIESKKDAIARGVASPNRADAVMLACAEDSRLMQIAYASAPASVGDEFSYWEQSP